MARVIFICAGIILFVFIMVLGISSVIEYEDVKIKFNIFTYDYSNYPDHWELRYDYVRFKPLNLRVKFNFIGQIRYQIWKSLQNRTANKAFNKQKYNEMMKIIQDDLTTDCNKSLYKKQIKINDIDQIKIEHQIYEELNRK